MKSARILIIDDDPNIRKTLSDILKVKGYETVTATDGAEGIAILAADPADLALIDLGLPDMSGLEVLTRIKKESPSTEAIILTGNATLDSAIEATNSGAFSYLLKPYDIDQMMLHVKRAIEKQQAREEIARHNSEVERFNAELKVLCDVSSAISRTIDMDGLLSQILTALADTKIFPFQMKGTLSLLENGRLRRASSIGLSEAELEPCRYIKPGECLCGRAMATGEVIVSKNSREDHRHTMCAPGTAPHGHVIIPLKAADRVAGVISIYTQTDVAVDGRMTNLLATLGNQIGIAIDNARLYEETKASSLHDPLTGLANRRFLEIQLEKAFEAARRYGEQLSAIMLDIDHFKGYNDSHGHAAGDRLLARLAGVLSRDMRSADYAFRYGGEEFFILLPRTGPAEACELAERLRKAVAAETGSTVSLGVASFDTTMREKEELIIKADAALYQAKRNGRNRVEQI